MQLHHCEGYIEDIEPLPICRETIQRARKCGFNTLEFAESCLNALKDSVISDENSYEDIARVIDSFVNASMPFLEKYRVKDIEVARFELNHTNSEAIVYLSGTNGGFIFVEVDENAKYSVKKISAIAIWRYLD